MSFFRKLVINFFPPPRFLEMPAVGIDISDEVIRFAELTRKGSAFELGVYGQEKMPQGIIEEGYIKDISAFSKVLEGLRKKHGFYFVKASLPDEKAYLFKTQIPTMDESEVRGALQFKIEENVPISLQDAVYDFAPINSDTKNTSQMDVGVTVIHQKVVTSYLSAFHTAGLVPLKLRTEAQAIAHAVIPLNDNSTYVVVSLRETKTVMSIVSRNVVQFTSSLPIGGRSIADSIKKQMSVDDAEVEKIRQGTVVHNNEDVFMSIVNTASVIRNEIKKFFIYWDGHIENSESLKIQHILLTGSYTLLGLDRYLAQSFEVPVVIADAWKNILSIPEVIPPITHHESLDYIPALGLALPHD